MIARELERLEEIHERVVGQGSITDEIKCPRCGSIDVSCCGGDMDGLGGYYAMYVCAECGRLPNGIRVFLVPLSEDEYQSRFRSSGNSTAMKPMEEI